MVKKIFKGLSLILLTFLLFTSVMAGTYQYILPSSVACMSSAELSRYPLLSYSETSAEDRGASLVNCRLFGFIPLKTLRVSNYENLKVYPGGIPFGIKFMTDGVMVVGFCEMDGKQNPASLAGLKINDMIKSVDGKNINSAAELTQIVESSGGKVLSLTYTRGGKEYTASLTPAYSSSEGKYKTGLYVKDSGAGIGTVTYIIPDTYSFGGLGHGICDASSGELIQMNRGSVVDVTISGVVKGLVGTPGEIKGYFSSGKTGSLVSNTHCGVYGMFAGLPDGVPCEPIPIGLRGEVSEGKAYIYCTLDTNKVEKYEIEISEIDRGATGNKCFTVKICDTSLLEKTGGIVQGMSGSPIIQNGKLVGAVTHVLINDPTTGYGIFIENMLNAAQMPMARAT